MADLWMVVQEDDEGMFFGDPEFHDTSTEARQAIMPRNPIDGYHFEIYACKRTT